MPNSGYYGERQSILPDASVSVAAKRACHGQRGFSLIEVMVVVVIMLVAAAIASPLILSTVYNLRLRGGAGDLAGLIQQARILAAKDNNKYAVRYTTIGGKQFAYVDLNNNSAFDATEPGVAFTGTVAPAAGAPSGSGGQPPAYVLAGDSGTGAVYTNSSTLGFSARGLPCDYSAPPTCTTPARNYFVYYLTDTRMGSPGWAAVAVTRAGRTKVVMWDGSTWH